MWDRLRAWNATGTCNSKKFRLPGVAYQHDQRAIPSTKKCQLRRYPPLAAHFPALTTRPRWSVSSLVFARYVFLNHGNLRLEVCSIRDTPSPHGSKPLFVLQQSQGLITPLFNSSAPLDF